MQNMIDISSWQKGLNLSELFSRNQDLGGVIVKATGGVSYVDPQCDGWVQWLIQNNKPWGFYHYMDDDYRDSDGKAEAEWFVKNTKNYFGHGIPFADYENPASLKGTDYLKEFLDAVYELTGIKCGVYCSLSVVQMQDFTEIANAGYPLWVAQYADNNILNGFIDSPWQKGSFAPFQKIFMQQYSSHGRLNGWSGNLDFDKFFGTAEEWLAVASGHEEPEKKPVDPLVVSDVLNNRYGAGPARVAALNNAGYDATDVQNKINELYAIALSCKKFIDGNEDYINSIMKIVRAL